MNRGFSFIKALFLYVELRLISSYLNTFRLFCTLELGSHCFAQC